MATARRPAGTIFPEPRPRASSPVPPACSSAMRRDDWESTHMPHIGSGGHAVQPLETRVGKGCTVTGFTWALMTAGFPGSSRARPAANQRGAYRPVRHVGMMEPIVPNIRVVHVCIGRVYACAWRGGVVRVRGTGL